MKFERLLYLIEILHQTTTIEVIQIVLFVLYLIEILHQTTTLRSELKRGTGCILSKFYIKPQLFKSRIFSTSSCILSKFYIKPQRTAI